MFIKKHDIREMLLQVLYCDVKIWNVRLKQRFCKSTHTLPLVGNALLSLRLVLANNFIKKAQKRIWTPKK